MKREADEDYSDVTVEGDGNGSKKTKFEEVRPSRVLHIRGVPTDVTEGEVIQLGLAFGRVTNLVVARKKNQALLEMEDISTADSMVKYYNERPPQIRNHTVHFQFSKHEQLKTENNSALNAGAVAALQAADKMIGNHEETRTVLRVVIENMLYPITVEVLKTIFSKVGQVQKIITYTKNDVFQSFIQLSDAISAKTALETLNGQNIYNGCCTLRIDYSKLQTLTVKYNNDKMWDYTNPNLPSGNSHQQQQQQKSGTENAGDGILGSFGSAFGGMGGMNAFGMAKLGGMSGLSGLSGMGNMGAFGGMGNMGGITGLGGMGGMSTMGGMGNMGGMGMGNMDGMSGMMSGGMVGQGQSQGQSSNNCVLIVSNLSEEKANPDVVFTLFGVYGTVNRVKIMFNKKDTALVQFADSLQAHQAMTCLDKVSWRGKNLKVSFSKHNYIQMPKEGQSESWMTKDYTNSPAQRFRNPSAKNAGNVNPPSATLHISNLAPLISEEQLTDLFSQFGSIVAFKFLPKEKKMALIQMGSIEQAIEALVSLHNYELEGKYNMRVSFTKSTI